MVCGDLVFGGKVTKHQLKMVLRFLPCQLARCGLWTVCSWRPPRGAEIEFRACNGLKTLVFTTVPGAHTYLADVMTRKQAGSLSVQYLKDVADVRAYAGESGIADGQIWIDQPYQLERSMQSCADKVPKAVKKIRRVRRNR